MQVAEQRVKLSEATYGPEHPMTATCLNDVGTFAQAREACVRLCSAPNPHYQ